jgi:cyclase
MFVVTPPRALCAAFAVLFAVGVWSAKPAAVAAPAAEVKVHEIVGGLHWIEGRGGNVGLCTGSDGVLVIDDKFKDDERDLVAAIESVSKAPWRFVLNTHHHGDHTGGNAAFGLRAPIVAHANVRTRLADEKQRDGAMPASGLPMVTYEDGLELHLNGENIRVKHYANAHTDGDSVVFFEKANTVHMGDLYFAGRFPFVDIDGGGSVRGLVAAVTEILDGLPANARIIPGHGPLSTKAELTAYRDMVSDSLKLVGDAKSAGKTLAQMKQERPLKKYEALAWQFINEEKFLETIARELDVK